ncbi:MAG: hypothetical protein CVT63_04000 [Candidatus Anoxymicrobium japonicum]|uniref:Uncharacterized protein n=1 Tax=Candidatus Anoxymicrobium japonicum TaxID=2013648 RepID=A0A2N3G671_9ACTN|nr:MAG: hypothetical protein CVT63_04000 [Candidatus Anoxymicrobium japonicum]
MRECRECGFPVKFARLFDWRSDGTIVNTNSGKTCSRITFLEADELESLFADLSNNVGINPDRFLVQAQKSISKAICANLPIRHIKRIPNTRAFRPQSLVGLLARLIAVDIAGLGNGRLSLDHYVAGKTLVVRFKNPVLVPLLVGDVAGFYESIENTHGSNVEYGLEDGDLIVKLTRKKESAAEQDRLYLEKVVPGEGPLRYERCLRCGVPEQVARTFVWDIERGIIINRRTKKRDVIVAAQSMNIILRELEMELGEDVPRLAYDHQKALAAKELETAICENAAAFLDRCMMNLALRGLGHPSRFEFDGSSLSVKTSTAYNQYLYAARLAAALEKVTGKTSDIKWENRHFNRGAYTISTKTKAKARSQAPSTSPSTATSNQGSGNVYR